MSTLRIHEPTMPPAGFAQFFSLLNILLESFLEAQRESAAAHKRYPFADW